MQWWHHSLSPCLSRLPYRHSASSLHSGSSFNWIEAAHCRHGHWTRAQLNRNASSARLLAAMSNIIMSWPRHGHSLGPEHKRTVLDTKLIWKTKCCAASSQKCASAISGCQRVARGGERGRLGRGYALNTRQPQAVSPALSQNVTRHNCQLFHHACWTIRCVCVWKGTFASLSCADLCV